MSIQEEQQNETPPEPVVIRKSQKELKALYAIQEQNKKMRAFQAHFDSYRQSQEEPVVDNIVIRPSNEPSPKLQSPNQDLHYG